jgi:TatA/E family protein of Tat protein translocase
VSAGGLACPQPRSRRNNIHRRSLLAPPPRSFLGVGAPEALLVGVVALVVFGPKGLAEAARSVGQALRAFQPTIREVVEVSQDLKGTLEKELGLDELRSAASTTTAAAASAQRAAAQAVAGGGGIGEGASAGRRKEEGLAEQEEQGAPAGEADPDIERKRAESARLAWGDAAAPTAPAPAAAAAVVSSSSSSAPVAAGPSLASMSVEDLEAELARRRGGGGGGSA